MISTYMYSKPITKERQNIIAEQQTPSAQLVKQSA
jgi:hypothetical protein